MGARIALITAAITTGIQGLFLMIFSGLALAQYLCVIDFLRDYTVLTYIKILYFFNPSCGRIINIGNSIDGIPNQAFIILNKEPLPTTRVFYINCTNLAISALSIITSAVLMVSAARGSASSVARWLWTTITICACVVDSIATISLLHDTFYVTTLENILIYLNAQIYGIGNADIDMSWGSWVMVILYSRIGIMFFLNIALLFVVFIRGNLPNGDKSFNGDCENNFPKSMPKFYDGDLDSEEEDLFTVPRLTLHEPTYLNNPTFESFVNPVLPSGRPETVPLSILKDTKRVHFPENLLSLPQRLDNLMADIQLHAETEMVQSLEESIASGEWKSQELHAVQPAPSSDGKKDHKILDTIKERRNTSTELQGQLPWTYIPNPSFNMRDNLPSDEYLPPVPLPDYNVKQNKTSVHRAPFKKLETLDKFSIPKVTDQVDVYFY